MARISKFSASYGTSAEIDGVWHKVQAGVEIELDAEDMANTESIKEKAWNTVFAEIEKQIEEIVKS